MTEVTAVSTRVGRLSLASPILAASGTFGSGLEAQGLGVDLSGLGGVVTKSITTKPRRGNPAPRILETRGGMLNSIGIMQGGVEHFLSETLPAFRELPCARIVNLAGESPEDFVTLLDRFADESGVDGFELNVSCPNVAGGLDFGIDPALLEPLVARCRGRTSRPLWVKLSPNVTDIGAIAKAAERGGADALSLVNTYLGMAVDWRRRRPILGSPTGAGGLSGPAIKPLALYAVHRVRRAVSLPLVGIGGITDADDVLEFVVTGCSAVQVGTANFLDPSRATAVARDLAQRAAAGEFPSIADLVGTLLAPGSRAP